MKKNKVKLYTWEDLSALSVVELEKIKQEVQEALYTKEQERMRLANDILWLQKRITSI